MRHLIKWYKVHPALVGLLFMLCIVLSACSSSHTGEDIRTEDLSDVSVSQMPETLASAMPVERNDTAGLCFGLSTPSKVIEAYNDALHKQYPGEFSTLALAPAAGTENIFHPEDESTVVTLDTNANGTVVAVHISMPLQHAYVNQTAYMEMTGLFVLIAQSEADQIQIAVLHYTDLWEQFRLALDDSETFSDVSFAHSFVAGDVRCHVRTVESEIRFEMFPTKPLAESGFANTDTDMSQGTAEEMKSEGQTDADAAQFYRAGIYMVGVDIPPGVYYMRALSTTVPGDILICSDRSGTPESEIYRDVTNTFTFVDLVEG